MTRTISLEQDMLSKSDCVGRSFAQVITATMPREKFGTAASTGTRFYSILRQ